MLIGLDSTDDLITRSRDCRRDIKVSIRAIGGEGSINTTGRRFHNGILSKLEYAFRIGITEIRTSALENEDNRDFRLVAVEVHVPVESDARNVVDDNQGSSFVLNSESNLVTEGGATTIDNSNLAFDGTSGISGSLIIRIITKSANTDIG